MNKVGCLDEMEEEDVVTPKVVVHFVTGAGFLVAIEDYHWLCLLSRLAVATTRGQEVERTQCLVVFGCNNDINASPNGRKVKVLTSEFVAAQRLVQLVRVRLAVWIALSLEEEVLDAAME